MRRERERWDNRFPVTMNKDSAPRLWDTVIHGVKDTPIHCVADVLERLKDDVEGLLSGSRLHRLHPRNVLHDKSIRSQDINESDEMRK